MEIKMERNQVVITGMGLGGTNATVIFKVFNE
jgi:3-oxoacyl-(acyl-carrier-protein) synthase